MSRKKPLLVLGAGGHGKVVADAARSSGWELAGFLDDSPARNGTCIWGLPVFTFERLSRERPELVTTAVALGIGDNLARARALARLVEIGFEVATVVHATAAVSPTAPLGEGTVVMANASINPDARVGRGCIVNTGAVVEHDCVLGDFVHLSPNAALGGGVSIGEGSHLGLGAVALPGLRIGAAARIGAGAVVTSDVAAGLTVVGVPARPLARKGTGA